MQHFFQFLANHWFLSLLFVVLFTWLIFEEAKSKGLGGQVNPQKLTYLMNRDEAKIVDIRDRDAFQQAHIIGALNIPSSDIEQQINKLQQYKKKKLVVVCHKGQSALKVMAQLKKLGFEDVQILAGGMSAWNSADMPTVSGKK